MTHRQSHSAVPALASRATRKDASTYVLGPDGLPARRVGAWVERKAAFVDRYSRMFATGMKNRWSRRTYLELFSGPGMSYIASQDRFFAGSALRAMNKDFTDFVFVDIDARATTAIAERASRLRLPRPPRVLLGDCNDLADDVLAAIPANSIAVAFIDPTNWQTRYTTIETLARYPHMDLLFTFHVGTMRRVAHLDLPALRAHVPQGASLGRAVDLPRERRIVYR